MTPDDGPDDEDDEIEPLASMNDEREARVFARWTLRSRSATF